MRMLKTIGGCAAATTLGALAVQMPSRAESGYMTPFNTKYPATSTTLASRMLSVTGSSCNVCHTPGSTSSSGSCYKNDIRAKLNAGFSISQALTAVAMLDSDGDGVPNEVEILAPRLDLPGQIGYHPGLRGPTGTGPCNSNPNTAVTNQLETPPATCYANCDGSTVLPVLTANDFQCFLTSFAAGQSYANCDGSTVPPVLTANDFQCFLTRYAAGCS